MNELAEESIYLCNQILELLEQDYQALYTYLSGEVYDGYKQLVLDEIERITVLKEKLKTILSGTF